MTTVAAVGNPKPRTRAAAELVVERHTGAPAGLRPDPGSDR